MEPSEDWIIFEITNPPIHPTKISIRNSGWSDGISSISLFIGSSVSDTKWYPLCSDINGIHNNNKDEQYFDIDESALETGARVLAGLAIGFLNMEAMK